MLENIMSKTRSRRSIMKKRLCLEMLIQRHFRDIVLDCIKSHIMHSIAKRDME